MPVRIASYQTGGSPEGFDFQPQLTSEPTAPEGGGTDGKGYVLTSIQHSATDTSLVDQTDTEASSRLFVGNLTLNSRLPFRQASVAELSLLPAM